MFKFIHLNLLASNHLIAVNVATITCVLPSVGDDGELRGTLVRMVDGNHVEVLNPMDDVLSVIPRG
jgi:hypothetical protein